MTEKMEQTKRKRTNEEITRAQLLLIPAYFFVMFFIIGALSLPQNTPDLIKWIFFLMPVISCIFIIIRVFIILRD